jgi:hypothetical protein
MNTIAVAGSTRTANRRRAWKWIVFGIGTVVIVALAILGFMIWHMNYIPPDLDVSTSRASAQGVFKATIRPAVDPIPINSLHRWTLHVETPDRKPIENAAITVDGGMPQHGHGLPTQPQITKYLGNGDYLIEGMKFQMAGWWVVDFTIDAANQHDTVRFNMILK